MASRTFLLAGRASTALSFVVMGVVLIVLTFEMVIRTATLPAIDRALSESRAVTDRDGHLLWAFLADDDRWRWLTRPADLSSTHRAMLIAYEDKRFYVHRGVDAVALARAFFQAIRNGRVVSGGSTITMQTVRLLDPKPRRLSAKLGEIVSALRLERHLSKREILTLYLTLTGFGGNIEGVKAAALGYFDKPPKALTTQEAALLVALPQAPESRRPDRNPRTAISARDRVLARMSARNIISVAAHSGITTPVKNPNFTRNAPHLALLAARLSADKSSTRTQIAGPLQQQVERVARRAIGQWPAPVNLAIVVLRNKDASIAAYLGGVDFADSARAGQVDLAAALRSPGSALKPFIYGLAFEDLIVHPDTIVTDEPISFDGYNPENFDGEYRGDITVRTALAHSVNTIAVALLDAVGTDRLMARLRRVDAPLALPEGGDGAGLAVALGGAGLSLFDLTRLYAALATDGAAFAPRILSDDPAGTIAQLVTAPVARTLSDILADVGPPPGFGQLRARDGGRRIAYKTGTSYGFRDAWAIGFDSTHTVGVWIGRPDGRPHLGSYGVTAAAPVMMRVMALLRTSVTDVANRKAAYGALTSPRRLPDRLKRFVSRGQIDTAGPVAIAFPRDSSVIGSGDGGTHSIPLQAEGGTPPYRWFIDGKAMPVASDAAPAIKPGSPGQFTVRVIDASGGTDQSSFWFDG